MFLSRLAVGSGVYLRLSGWTHTTRLLFVDLTASQLHCIQRVQITAGATGRRQQQADVSQAAYAFGCAFATA